MAARESPAIVEGRGPTAVSPSSLSRARSGWKNFSRRFDRRPKSIDISKLPQAAPVATNGTNGTLISHNTPQNTRDVDDEPPVTPTKAEIGEKAVNGTHPSSSSPPRTPENHRISTSSSTLSSPVPILRAPQLHRLHSQIFASSKDFKLPELPWLCGTWFLTHSSLPMWLDKRDVQITYTRIPGDRLEDIASFRPLQGNGAQEVLRGVDKVLPDGSYMWRGRGFGIVKVSKWEVLGWQGGGSKDAPTNPDTEQWVIAYFSKSAFSGPGISIYSRKRQGLSERKVRKLLEALRRLKIDDSGKGDFGRLVEEIIEIPRS